MMKRAWITLLIVCAIIGIAGLAGAELTVIGTATYEGKEYKLVYEDDQGLIWFDHLFPSSRWPQLTQQVSELNNPGILTYNLNPGVDVSFEGDWRLPKTMDGPRRFGFDGTTTAGFNITSSEMGHLYYKSLGGVGYYDTEGNARAGWGKPESEHEWGLKETGPFDNLDPGGQYWSSTEYAAYPEHAWAFNMYWGSQSHHAFKGSYNYLGLAVRPGKVAGR